MEIVSLQDFLTYPDPEWRIDQIFESQGLVGLYGATWSGKSFVALDWALSIAAGIPWQSKAVVQGPTVYVAAEGAFGLRSRAQAWLDHHRGATGLSEPFREALENPPILFLIETLPMLEGGAEDLVETLLEMDVYPKLVVIDTLARCFVGGDENEAADMSQFVASAGTIQVEVGATVVVVHHVGKDETKEERGSSVLRAAAETMIRVEMPQRGKVELTCTKQKNAEGFAQRIQLRLQKVGNSCVLVEGHTMSTKKDIQEIKKAGGSTKFQARQLSLLTGHSVSACESMLRRAQ